MTDKEMYKLAKIIVDAITVKQKELDQEFYENMSKTAEENQNVEYIVHLDQDKSEQERVVEKLSNLYALLDKTLSEEKFELAADIRESIKAIKKNFNIK